MNKFLYKKQLLHLLKKKPSGNTKIYKNRWSIINPSPNAIVQKELIKIFLLSPSRQKQ